MTPLARLAATCLPVFVFVPDPAYHASASADDAAPAAELHAPIPINFISENETAHHAEPKAFSFLCRACGLTTTTQTRSGPEGPGTLCNKYEDFQ